MGNASLDITRATDIVYLAVDTFEKQGLEWLLMLFGLNLWGFAISSNGHDINNNSQIKGKVQPYSSYEDDSDDDDDDDDLLGVRPEWVKTPLDLILIDSYEKARSVLDSKYSKRAAIEKDAYMNSFITDEDRIYQAKKPLRYKKKQGLASSAMQQLKDKTILHFAALPLHKQHFRVELVLAIGFIVLWASQFEIGTIGAMVGILFMLIGVMTIPSYFDGVLRFIKNFILVVTFPIRWLVKNLFKILKASFVCLSTKLKEKWESWNKKKEDEDEKDVITVSAKFANLVNDSDSDTEGNIIKNNDNDDDDDAKNITNTNDLIRLSEEEENKARQRREAFGIDSIWQWISLGTNPDFPFFKSEAENNVINSNKSKKSTEENQNDNDIDNDNDNDTISSNSDPNPDSDFDSDSDSEAGDNDNNIDHQFDETAMTDEDSDASSLVTEITDLSSIDSDEDDIEDEYYDWVAADKDNSRLLLITRERNMIQNMIDTAARWRKYRRSMVLAGAQDVERLEREKAENLRKWERRQIKRIIREAARQRRIRESFCIYAAEVVRQRLITKLKWKRIRVYFKAEAKRIMRLRIEHMKKMRRVRAAFKEFAWEQRSRYCMDAEEAFMRDYIERHDQFTLNQAMIKEEKYLRDTYKTLAKMERSERIAMADAERETKTFIEEFNRSEKEKQTQNLVEMRREEKEMRAIMAKELQLQQDNEAKINEEMIAEEAYIRQAYKDLAELEAREREQMANDEWQQIQGRKILRVSMCKELLRESKRIVCRRKARKMYIWRMFILKAKSARSAYFARRAAMRAALLRYARRDKMAKIYQRRRIIVGIFAKAKGILQRKADRLRTKNDKKNENMELKAMAHADFESMIYEVSTRKIVEYAKLKEEKQARKLYRSQVRESRRRKAVTALNAGDQSKLQRIIDETKDQDHYFEDDSSYSSSSYYDSDSDGSDVVKSKSKKEGSDSNSDDDINIVAGQGQAEFAKLGLNFQASTLSDSSEVTESDEDKGLDTHIEDVHNQLTINWSSGSLSSLDSYLDGDSSGSSVSLSSHSNSSSDSSRISWSSESDYDSSGDSD